MSKRYLVWKHKITKGENPESATQSSGKHRRQDYQEIETAYEELKKQDKKVSEDDALDSLRAAVRTMIRVCNNFIENFPRLVTEQAYKHKLVEIMQEAKSYIKELEGDFTELALQEYIARSTHRAKPRETNTTYRKKRTGSK